MFESFIKEKYRKFIVMGALGLLVGLIMYCYGLICEFVQNRIAFNEAGGVKGGAVMQMPSLNVFDSLKAAFKMHGIILLIILVGLAFVAYKLFKMYSRFDKGEEDERGFKISPDGTYGTANWMKEEEMKGIYDIEDPKTATGTILGERKGKVVCMPDDTRLNKHILIFGASGTMKSRAIIRNHLFQSIRRGESTIITDPKGELYEDTSELFRKHGYDVKVFNLIDPAHSDSWNCMSDMNGDSLLASVLTNVIIGNTSSGKGDHFWDNGEANLLKALILYVDSSDMYTKEQKNLGTVYNMLTDKKIAEITAIFDVLPAGHPAKAPYNLFAQASDQVKAGIILGLGTRLQVLQNQSVRDIIAKSDIDLIAPGGRKCAYYIILSDQDSTMAFLSSLFFSCLFIKITRFAGTQPGNKCPVGINMVLDEFNNVGKLGGAADGSDFTRTLSVIRSRNVHVMMAVQSLGQLENRYPNNLWSEITANCDIQLMLGCNDDVTAEYISDQSGDVTIMVDSTRISKKTIAMVHMIPQYMENKGEGKRKLLTPDEVKHLPNTEMLVITRGQNMLRLNKFDYTKHPMSKEMEPSLLIDYIPERLKGEHDENSTDDAFSSTPSSASSSESDYMTLLMGGGANGGTSASHTETKRPSAKPVYKDEHDGELEEEGDEEEDAIDSSDKRLSDTGFEDMISGLYSSEINGESDADTFKTDAFTIDVNDDGEVIDDKLEEKLAASKKKTEPVVSSTAPTKKASLADKAKKVSTDTGTTVYTDFNLDDF